MNVDKAIMKLHTKQRCSNGFVKGIMFGNNSKHGRFSERACHVVKPTLELPENRGNKAAENEKRSCDCPHFKLRNIFGLFLVLSFGDEMVSARKLHIYT